ncbi:uncharacterized protein LOC117227446 isoform X1 [Megalopta genalis]|uniref:uncharacterized protein LOC117227446 isoform X1 n=1 Tax=Megalopta genalis TaxID=115081 RepID=UPI003FD6BD8E
MDRTSSRDSDSPTIRKVPEKPPFKLCFSKDQILGKSSVRTLKTNCTHMIFFWFAKRTNVPLSVILVIVAGDSIAPKFYSRQCESGGANDPNESRTLDDITPGEKKSPTDLNCYPYRLLSSHAYGWWHEQGIRPKDSRFNFHKKTSDLVHFQMKVYAEDRRLDVPKH